MVNAINSLLLWAGDTALWLGRVLYALLAAVFGGLSDLLNYVLSPVLTWANPVCTALADGVYAVLGVLPIWLSLTLLSAIAGVIMLIAFRYTSNQKAIGRARDDITANLLALKLYKDEIGVAFRSQGRLLGALGRLQWHMLLPVLIMALPLIMGVAQMGLRHQWRPLRPGEEALVTLRLKPDPARTHEQTLRLYENTTLAPSPGVSEREPGDLVGPVPGGNALVWRFRAGEPGTHVLKFAVDGETHEKSLVVGEPFQPVSAERPGHAWTAQLLHPREKPLPAKAPVASIEISYPGVESYIYGADWWVLYFFVVSMAAALIFKPMFKVRF
jgi:hypothetical protein